MPFSNLVVLYLIKTEQGLFVYLQAMSDSELQLKRENRSKVIISLTFCLIVETNNHQQSLITFYYFDRTSLRLLRFMNLVSLKWRIKVAPVETGYRESLFK